MSQPQFPCDTLPAEPSAARLLGLYPQRQQGLWMQRVRVPAGRLTAGQWAAMAEIARQLTPGEPLHLTTRQDVEIHGLSAASVPRAQQLLAEAGLTSIGACGDTIRNVTICPCSGIAPGAPDLLPLGRLITQLLQSQAGVFALPRKFKISLSACAAGCSQPWINDLGFVAERRSGGWEFRVVVAGSMGARPATGVAYRLPLCGEEVLPFTLAAMRVFAAQGDREHRHKARLRHVRQRLGDEAFLDVLEQAFAATRLERVWPGIPLATGPGLRARGVLRFEDGNVTVEDAQALADLAGRDELRVVIGNHHQVLVFARDEQVLDSALGEARLWSLSAPGPRVVACPGTRWCARGLADTARLAQAVRDRLRGQHVGDVLIAISGCPNGCAHSGVADVGAVGVVAGGETQRTQAWNLLAGGEDGLGPGLAQPVADQLGLDAAAKRIVELAVEASAGGLGGQE